MKVNRERHNRYKALLLGAQLGSISATLIMAAIMLFLAVPEAGRGNTSALVVPVFYLFYGLLLGTVFVNVFLWLILLPIYGRSAKSLSLKQAVGFAVFAGPIYVILLVATFTPQRFRFDIESIATYCGIGILYGVCLAYWCVRLEQQSARRASPKVALMEMP